MVKFCFWLFGINRSRNNSNLLAEVLRLPVPFYREAQDDSLIERFTSHSFFNLVCGCGYLVSSFQSKRMYPEKFVHSFVVLYQLCSKSKKSSHHGCSLLKLYYSPTGIGMLIPVAIAVPKFGDPSAFQLSFCIRGVLAPLVVLATLRAWYINQFSLCNTPFGSV